MNKIKVLLTGGCGFIGHHFVEHFIKNTDWDIVIFDRLDYASIGFDRLRDIDCFNKERVKILTADLTSNFGEGLKKEIGDIDYILHLGANTHVDNSIKAPLQFVKDNVEGTVNLLEFARELPNLKKFLYFSTDEVFGPAPEGINYKEGDRHNPGNPYAASKAAAEDFCIAYANTYKMPIIITNTMNVIGERQHPEKFVPMVIRKAINNELVHIHSDKDCNKAGSRFYIHARNVADAIMLILKQEEMLDIHDVTKGKFNIVGEKEIDNLQLARLIAKHLDKKLKYDLIDFHSSRPGHDLRYALDGDKMKSLGWELPLNLQQSLYKTIDWSIKNSKWLDASISKF